MAQLLPPTSITIGPICLRTTIVTLRTANNVELLLTSKTSCPRGDVTVVFKSVGKAQLTEFYTGRLQDAMFLGRCILSTLKQVAFRLENIKPPLLSVLVTTRYKLLRWTVLLLPLRRLRGPILL